MKTTIHHRRFTLRYPGFRPGFHRFYKGFTLIEILVAIVIIGILGAIALPQYQRALLKSRYAALMPIAKSMANSNEAYYLEHGIYADDPQDLLIQGQSRYTDDTELEFGTVSDYAYVLAKNEDKIPNNTFVVYQKHSGEFPGEIHCEALADNDLAESVCKSFGGNESIGKTLTDGYETYVLFGTGNGVAPTGDNGGDEPDTNTEPEPTVTKMTAEEAQAMADAKCIYPSKGCIGIPNDDGTVSVCEKNSAKLNENGECVSNGTNTGTFETVYDASGTKKEEYDCRKVDSEGNCYGMWSSLYSSTYDVDGSYTRKERTCGGTSTSETPRFITKEGICSTGIYSAAVDQEIQYGDAKVYATCAPASVNATNGECGRYTWMREQEQTMKNHSYDWRTMKLCTDISNTTCNNYVNYYAAKQTESGVRIVGCYAKYSNRFERDGDSFSTSDLTQGKCPTDYSLKQYNPETKSYTNCSSFSSINWEEATCS